MSEPSPPQDATGREPAAAPPAGAQPGAAPAAAAPRASAPQGSTGAAQSDVLFAGTARHTSQLTSYLKWTLVCMLGGVAAYFLKDLAFVQERGLPVWVLVLAGIPGILWTYLVVITSKYTIDRRRVELEEGVITRRVDSLELWRVLDVQYEQSVLDRLTGNAKIRLMGTDQTHPTLLLHGMPNHRQLFNDLREAVQTARHSNRPMELVGGGGGDGLEHVGEMFDHQ